MGNTYILASDRGVHSAREPLMRIAMVGAVCAMAGAAAVLVGRRSWRRFLWWLFGNGE